MIGVDVQATTVDTINRGEIHIIEPSLDRLVGDVVARGLLKATLTPEPADAFLIAVPTPFRGEHEPDLTYVERAARSIAPVLRPGNVVILESTSPVGATEAMTGWLQEERPDLRMPRADETGDIAIAYCPERVLPGNVLHELVHNDRVIGGLTPACADRARAIYRLFVEGECIVTTARTAELCKLTENSFRDVNIAFANELSTICDRLGIDVWETIRLANRHPRVNILQPGPGVGGHCIAVDPWFIVHSCPDQARLIATARRVNDAKPDWVVDQVASAIATIRERRGADARVTVSCLGLSFKPDIDDLRESPALDITRRLAAQKSCDLLVVEPFIAALPSDLRAIAQLTDAHTAIAKSSTLR